MHYQHLDWKSILDYTNRVQIPVRFIEMMPIGYGAAYTGGSNEELFRQIEECYGNVSEAGTVRNREGVQISGICRTRKRSSNPENMAQVLQLTTVFRD